MNKSVYEAIAMQYLPHGYRVEYRKSLSGRHYGMRKLIKTPKPVTADALYIFLHECAHAYLHTGSGRNTRPHVREFEAEMWAHAKMEENGIPVSEKMTNGAKRYVARKIVQAERRGGKKLDASAVAFAGEYLPQMRATYNKLFGLSQHPGAAA